MVRSPDGRFVFLKENTGITVLDADRWTVHHHLALGSDPASMTGLAISVDGASLYTTDATTGLHELRVNADGTVTETRRIALQGPKGPKDNTFPCGVALFRDGRRAAVCLSRTNALGVIDLASGTLAAQAGVGVAPFSVLLSPDESTAYVSVWGGRRPADGEPSADSAGTKALVDERGVSASGGVSIVNLASCKEVGYIETGLSASAMALTRDGATLYVANANHDTVSIIDTAARKRTRQIVIKPDATLPFGSMPSALALSPDERTLYAACAGNNAVAVLELGAGSSAEPVIAGWIPTGWYPGALLTAGDDLLIANIKGVGSRTARDDGSFNSRRHRGSVQRLSVPAPSELGSLTAAVKRDSLVPQVLREIETGRARRDAGAVPIPARPGEPSVIEHVIYVIKENRTYDQVFGDLAAGDKPRGNGKPELCIFGRSITPNHHALAERFVLLDNYYCNGVLSADGHSWATEGNSTPYLERSFGGFKRTYTYGNDPLTYSSSGFIWDHTLAAGFSFRNFGELAEAGIKPPAGMGKKWTDVYTDWRSGANAYRFPEEIGIDKLRRYSDPDAPGWNLDITDQIRADHFIEALKHFEAEGSMPAFITLHLPNDHTSGVSEGHPTPRAYVADNDLALGRIVEAVSHSRFWSTTCMFINEDDPQDGWDHVDGHRSLCLVVSPYVKRGAVVSQFYNQAGVVHTIERIFGLTAANQLYAAAPVMTECFSNTPDAEPYAALTPGVSIDEMNPPKPPANPKPYPGDGSAPPSQKGGGPGKPSSRSKQLDLYALTAKQDFSKPDMVNDNEFNLVLWHAAKGLDTPYPRRYAGAHGRGLSALGLRLDPTVRPDDDDDEDDRQRRRTPGKDKPKGSDKDD
jgi:YVTN family beta-propeller protein